MTICPWPHLADAAAAVPPSPCSPADWSIPKYMAKREPKKTRKKKRKRKEGQGEEAVCRLRRRRGDRGVEPQLRLARVSHLGRGSQACRPCRSRQRLLAHPHRPKQIQAASVQSTACNLRQRQQAEGRSECGYSPYSRRVEFLRHIFGGRLNGPVNTRNVRSLDVEQKESTKADRQRTVGPDLEPGWFDSSPAVQRRRTKAFSLTRLQDSWRRQGQRGFRKMPSQTESREAADRCQHETNRSSGWKLCQTSLLLSRPAASDLGKASAWSLRALQRSTTKPLAPAARRCRSPPDVFLAHSSR